MRINIFRTIIIFLFILVASMALFYFYNRDLKILPNKIEQTIQKKDNDQSTPNNVFNNQLNEKLTLENTEILPASYSVKLPVHYYQTFNNCGPATLAMVLRYYGVKTDQKELGLLLRPYQNSQGDNDDKHTSLEEMAGEAEKRGYSALFLPDGNIELIKKYIYKDIPVITVTWLKKGEDIGHYRVIRGYNEDRKILIQDDSYQGPNKEYTYDDFNEIWQPFNYRYMVIFPQEKTDIVKKISENDYTKETAWQNALDRALEEESEDPNNIYPKFNQVVAYYYLGNYSRSIGVFEKIKDNLPFRMIWYQIEPILSYMKLGNYEKVMSMTEYILQNNNKAYSELYLLRGDIYFKDGDYERAKQEYEKAKYYNVNLPEATEALQKINSFAP